MKAKKGKFKTVNEIVERAFLGVIRRKRLVSELSLKDLFEEIGIFVKEDESICWECWGKGILGDLVKKELVSFGELTIKEAGITKEKVYALTPKGHETFAKQEIRDEE